MFERVRIRDAATTSKRLVCLRALGLYGAIESAEILCQAERLNLVLDRAAVGHPAAKIGEFLFERSHGRLQVAFTETIAARVALRVFGGPIMVVT